MSQLLIRDLDEATVEEIRKRAKRNGRSMQKELKMLLERAMAAPSWHDPTGTVFPPVIPASVKGTPASELLIQDRR